MQTAETKRPYIGRFAPSPSGPLHLGSLLAATASYLDARANNGQWLLRIEDIDPPREVAGARQAIIGSLIQHHLHWDGPIVLQSERHAAYRHILDSDIIQQHSYPCTCTRAQLRHHNGYTGACRHQKFPCAIPHAIRLAVETGEICFNDAVQGPQTSALKAPGDDFVIHRKDGLFAYQLAVVIDDHWQQINHIVRGSDLLDATAKQIYLQQLLGAARPNYLHIPVLEERPGAKLSKQNHATAIEATQASDNLRRCLSYLGQDPVPSNIKSCTDILQYATQQWDTGKIPRQMAIALD